MKLFRLIAASLVAASFCTPIANAESKQVHPLAIGSSAPDFDLPGVDEKNYTLKNFADAKILAVVFTCNHCPTAQAYEQRLFDMQRDYSGKGVAIVAISPNDPHALRLDELGYSEYSDSFEEMKLRAAERKFPFPYLYDGDTQTVATAYGCLATPHIFIFDAKRKLRYQGRIDDGEVTEITSNDARNALDALLAGKPVPVETTRVHGCSTKWIEKRDASKAWLEKVAAEPVELKLIDEAAVRELAANKGDRWRLVNIWATWCGPCVAEMDEIANMNRRYRRRPFEVVTISIDAATKQDDALKVLKEKTVSATNYLFTEKSTDKLADALDKEWPGPVPYTILIAPGGKIVWRHTGAIEPVETLKAIVDHIGRTYAK